VFPSPSESSLAQYQSIDEINNVINAGDIVKQKLEIAGVEGSLQMSGSIDQPTEQDDICLYFVNEHNLETCPRIKVLIGNQTCTALIDTGCQGSIISEELYTDLQSKAMESLELPTQHVILQCAFTGKTKRVKKQAMIELNLDGVRVDQIIFVTCN
jgi:hypothetical protein